ncbi:MAG TPA: GerMN domain-containing protein [Candidatus Lustribacter sp.]|nr:GerMN domain-containing protein [Candidatus Lustribacter sp.]
MVAAPVYYIADVPDFGPRLYREFHRTPVLGGDRIRTSLTQMFAGSPADPDYSSPWPADTAVLSVATNGTTATVDLSGFVALGAAFESAAVQQLVYTVTAADPSVRTVRLRVNGAVPPSGHSDWSAPIARDDPLDIQAHVWILGPAQGATVRSPVTVKVLGTGWEGNVPLKVYRGSAVVAQGFVTTMMGGFAEAQRAFTLAPGSYEIRAYNDNGKDSSLDLWDSKAFTVR